MDDFQLKSEVRAKPETIKRKTIAFSLSPAIEERLRSFCLREDRVISRVVERALVEYLDRQEQKPTD